MPGFRKKILCLATFILAVFMLFCALPREESNMEEETTNCLECGLEIAGCIPVGEPVKLRFTLENTCPRTLYVLTWYTPLEGLRGNIFRILGEDGEAIPYRGLMVKRGQPAKEDYLSLEPGKKATVEVNLADSYDLSKTGSYRLQFTGRLHDVTDDKDEIPRKQDEHQPGGLQCGTVVFKITGNNRHHL